MFSTAGEMSSIQALGKKTACVTGAAGYMASWLFKLLLEGGYTVNATVRDPANQSKVSHLLALQGSGGALKLFRANLTEEGSFDDAVYGCAVVFHVATPVHFDSKDPENDTIKPAIQGTLNVLKSCTKAKVKRVVLTSSSAAVSINKLPGTGLVVNEESWTDVEFLASEKPPTWGYPTSKALAEKAAWKFAQENNIDLVSIIPVLMAGRSLSPEVHSSICLSMSLLTGNDFLINGLKGMQLLSGSISLGHVEDICRANIFVAEKPSASGRYICCPINTCVTELAKFLSERYPQYKVPTDFGDFPTEPKLSISSEKLIEAGFTFKHGIEEIYDECVEYFQEVGLLAK